MGVTRTTTAVFNTPVAGGSVAITAGATNNENYTLVLSNGVMGITRAPISSVSGITANSKVADGSTSATLNTGGAGYAGIVPGDVLAVATATGNFGTSVAGSAKTVYITGITLGGAAADNYTLVNDTATTTAGIVELPTLGAVLFAAPPLSKMPTVAPSGLTVTGMNAMVESAPTASGGSVGISVQTIREPSEQQPGIVSVTVARKTLESGFRFPLPTSLLVEAAASGAPVQATTLTGQPLPPWLRYDPASHNFVATDVPTGALPLQVLVSVGRLSVVLTISEGQGDGPSPRKVVVARSPAAGE
ncbi:MAG: hypothetical protein HY853_01815 [Burkholderiales bacterium]|nr:hypothetical protein [Burkholderiales bacterium]